MSRHVGRSTKKDGLGHLFIYNFILPYYSRPCLILILF